MENSMENKSVGRWGRLHYEYLMDTESERYRRILSSDGLWNYLDTVDEDAQKEYERMINEIREQMGISEQKPGGNQADWQELMQMARILAEEHVLKEIIYKR